MLKNYNEVKRNAEDREAWRAITRQPSTQEDDTIMTMMTINHVLTQTVHPPASVFMSQNTSMETSLYIPLCSW